MFRVTYFLTFSLVDIVYFIRYSQVNITVEDENDNPPVFDRQWYEGSIEENSPPGSEVKLETPLRIHDADAGINAHFSVNIKGNGSDLFVMDQKTLKIAVKEGAVIDREYRDVYYLRLVARDKGLRQFSQLSRIYRFYNWVPRSIFFIINISIYLRNKYIREYARVAVRGKLHVATFLGRN